MYQRRPTSPWCSVTNVFELKWNDEISQMKLRKVNNCDFWLKTAINGCSSCRRLPSLRLSTHSAANTSHSSSWPAPSLWEKYALATTSASINIVKNLNLLGSTHDAMGTQHLKNGKHYKSDPPRELMAAFARLPLSQPRELFTLRPSIEYEL